MFALRIISAAICACVLLAGAPLHAQQQRSITIGVAEGDVASQTLGTAICALINSGSPEHGMLCSTQSHVGPVENLQALETDQQTIAIVMSDVHASAYEGRDRFEAQAFKDLRSLFSAQARAFTLVARKSSGIAALDDLKGRHVNIGNPDSTQRLLMNAVLRAKGWTPAVFASVLELNAKDQLAALCDGKADAAVFAAAHPDPLVQEALGTCGGEIVPTTDEDIIRLVDDSMYFTEAVIPAAAYKPENKEITTFGLRTTLVTTKNADRALVYDAVKIIFGNIDKLRMLDPTLNELEELEMTRSGLTAPLHAGALRYFREKNLQ
jgi:hypothetical protein